MTPTVLPRAGSQARATSRDGVHGALASAHLEEYARRRQPRVADAHAVQVRHAPGNALHNGHERRPAAAQRWRRERAPGNRLTQAAAIAELLKGVQRMRCACIGIAADAASGAAIVDGNIGMRHPAAGRKECLRQCPPAFVWRWRRRSPMLAQAICQCGHHIGVAEALRSADAGLNVRYIIAAHWCCCHGHAARAPETCSTTACMSVAIHHHTSAGFVVKCLAERQQACACGTQAGCLGCTATSDQQRAQA